MTSFCETTKTFDCFIDNNEFDNLLTELTKTTMINEPELLEVLPLLLEKIGDYKFSEKATRCGEVIISKMNPFAMKAYMNILYEGLTSLKWQIKKASLILLGSLAKHQKEIVKYNLPNMILKLITMVSDVKKDVKEQTKICFEELCSVIDNVDIIKIIPSVINGYMEPVKYTEASLDCLVATSFINDVDMPTLGLLVPVLTRGMREKKVANQRRAALVIGNMCKLVNDPRTAYEFYPILKPVLEKGIDEIAIEEVRKVCEN